MNLPLISWKYLLDRPLNTILNILILSLGVAIIIILLLVSHQIEEKLQKNAKGIDLVVGAKGSPIQIILSSIFHIDFPTGNIKLEEAKTLAKNPLIKWVSPLALGDSYKGYRIVGTNHRYPQHYQAELKEGRFWEQNFEVNLGAEVAAILNLKIGDTFFGAHGMDGATSHVHDTHAYQVAGIFRPSGTVLDQLILTNVESVWEAHHHEGEKEHKHENEHHEHEEEHAHDDHHDDAHEHQHPKAQPKSGQNEAGNPEISLPVGDAESEITAMLVKFRSPMGAIQLPRFINSQTNMQAAAPAFEISRLFSMLGIGVSMAQGFAYLMVFIAVLSIFVALYNALKERKYDLAIMRTLGCSKSSLMLLVLLEGLYITIISSLLGLFLGHLTLEIIARFFQETGQVGITGLRWLPIEIWVVIAAQIIGLFTALIPAVQAYRTDISIVLAKG